MQQTANESRRGLRVPVRVTVILRETTFDGSLYFVSTNLSTMGIFLESDMLLQEGVIVHLRFLLPDEIDPIRAVGKVVRVEDRCVPGVVPGLGLEFLEIDTTGHEQINRYIDRNI